MTETGRLQQEISDFIMALFKLKNNFLNLIPQEVRTQFSPLEMMILHFVLINPRCRTSLISSELGIPPSTLTGLLNRLEEKGMIKRVRDTVDKRSFLIEGQLLNHQPQEKIIAALQAVAGDNPEQNAEIWWNSMTEGLGKINEMLIAAAKR